MFLHGGWGHLLGNALFFWVFGNNIEDSMGALRFLAFYLICGLAAAGTHILIQPASPDPDGRSVRSNLGRARRVPRALSEGPRQHAVLLPDLL